MGIDVGTSGSKCTVFDEEGHVLAYAYREYEMKNPSPAFYELNPEEVWGAVKEVLGRTIEECPGEKIAAICVSSFGEAAVPVDKKGEVLHNSLLYTDSRGSRQCEWLKEQMGAGALMRLTGIPAHPMYTINKVMWFKENRPDLYGRTWKFLLFEDFIIHRLTGLARIDYSLASRTMAFNISEKRWAPEVFDCAGIACDIFSEPVPSGTVVGEIRAVVADELGLNRDVKVVTGGHDQICAAVGGGIISEDRAINGIGTVECITPAFSEPLLNDEMLENHFACVPHALEGMYVTYAFNFTGGSLLKWYRDNFAVYEKMRAEVSGENVYALLDDMAAREPTDLLVLPHFAGAGTPHMDPGAEGAIMGLSLETTSAEFYRALLEGVTYEMMYNLECLEEAGIAVKELRAVGGGASSDLWLQIKADILNRRIVALDVEEAGTLGTAILAGVATGIYGSLAEAVENLVRVEREFVPISRNHAHYRDNYRKYRRMYSAVRQTLADTDSPPTTQLRLSQ